MKNIIGILLTCIILNLSAFAGNYTGQVQQIRIGVQAVTGVRQVEFQDHRIQLILTQPQIL
ncbi:MAG: hypothetical protein IPJ26_19905 [Bacteroidetes bacterium]|nr:hypothetical protein [Bacteroidota bacterium]